MATDAIVIVGGGLAAARVASEYRAAGSEGDVTVLSAEPDPRTTGLAHQLQVLGDVGRAATCILRGSLEEGRLIGFHLADDGRLVGAVIHGQAADTAVELEDLLRRGVVVGDPARLTDENLRPVDAVGAR